MTDLTRFSNTSPLIVRYAKSNSRWQIERIGLSPSFVTLLQVTGFSPENDMSKIVELSRLWQINQFAEYLQ